MAPSPTAPTRAPSPKEGAKKEDLPPLLATVLLLVLAVLLSLLSSSGVSLVVLGCAVSRSSLGLLRVLLAVLLLRRKVSNDDQGAERTKAEGTGGGDEGVRRRLTCPGWGKPAGPPYCSPP